MGVVLGEVRHGVVLTIVAAKSRVVAVEDNRVLARRGEDAVVCEGACGAEVVDKDEIPTGVGEYLILVLVPELDHRYSLKVGDTLDELEHRLVEVLEEAVLEEAIRGQAPLATGILIAPAVALAREVDPLRVTKFVSHKIEIPAIHRGAGDEADHLVECRTAVHRLGVVRPVHMVVHLGIDEAEDDRLVADQRLIV